ncbi:hypothetical protein LOK49_Contig379G00001 [Camellia lanceoleosa]|nr:hypothetical protein LOK49_Contig379G00001 [Camellia lanceoleosa]
MDGEMVTFCCNEISQPGTLGYLDAVYNITSSLLHCYVLLLSCLAKQLDVSGACSNVLQTQASKETLFATLIFSVAYGSWYLSFNTLYRSTQVFPVQLGGMSILTGHVSAEQLMKYVLYCEWLIYAAWRLEDNLSSLLEAIGASEKVFQLMVLMPSDQFLSKGMTFF